MRKLTKSDLDLDTPGRFWKYLSPSNAHECWEWQGPRMRERRNLQVGYSFGYGYLHVNPDVGREYAHRLAYVLMVGDIPADRLVLHNCDNPRCCNPSHLRLGTYADNARDREERKRSAKPYGPKPPRAPAPTKTNRRLRSMPDEPKYCLHCGEVLARREGERVSQFILRVTCNKTCSNRMNGQKPKRTTGIYS